MPDHVHLVLQGELDDSDLQQLVARWKQVTGYEHKRATQNGLWQESYYDHVLRDDEETWRAVRYALENPVRKRLVSDWWEYQGCGSDVWNREQMEELWHRPSGLS